MSVKFAMAVAQLTHFNVAFGRTQSGLKYFDSITNGWIDYSHNMVLVKLFSHALVSSSAGHESALEKIKEDIALLKQKAGLRK